MNKKILLALAGVIVAGVAYYGLSPLFNTITLDEALPGVPEESVGLEDAVAAPEPNPIETAPVAITDTLAHPASGTARIVSADGSYFLRYENFKTINGPDIFVYLSKDLSASDFVDLGRVKATEGNINYEIPAGINPRDYPYALVWCKAFGILFNSAKLY